MPTLRDFESIIKQVADNFRADPHHRLRSWDHANRYWKKYVADRTPDADHAAPHLAFYLASFGMYRGSTALLYRDYRVLVPVVTLLKREPLSKWSDIIFSQEPEDTLIADLRGLEKTLRQQLQEALARPNKKKVNVSATLLSKILHVSLNCVPAFDTAVNRALKKLQSRGGSFSRGSLGLMIQLARENRELIRCGKELIKRECSIDYPLTRIFDLYLWHRGAPSTAKG